MKKVIKEFVVETSNQVTLVCALHRIYNAKKQPVWNSLGAMRQSDSSEYVHDKSVDCKVLMISSS